MSEPRATVARHIVCGRCRRTFRSAEWLELELVELLDSDSVRQILSDWPSGHSIEIRRCTGCGGEIARTAQ